MHPQSRFAPAPPAAPPAAPSAAPPAAPLAAPLAAPSSALRTAAIVAGVILLALGGWFVRQRFIVPLLYGKPEEDEPPPARAPRVQLRGAPRGAPPRGAPQQAPAPQLRGAEPQRFEGARRAAVRKPSERELLRRAEQDEDASFFDDPNFTEL